MAKCHPNLEKNVKFYRNTQQVNFYQFHHTHKYVLFFCKNNKINISEQSYFFQICLMLFFINFSGFHIYSFFPLYLLSSNFTFLRNPLFYSGKNPSKIPDYKTAFSPIHTMNVYHFRVFPPSVAPNTRK